MEKAVALKNNFEFHPIPAAPFRSNSAILDFNLYLNLFLGVFQSINLISRFHPDAIIATGAYVSAPVLFAALLKKVPFYLLEQNRIPGRVVRLFAPYAQRTFLTFPLQLHGPTLLTGTPLRKEIVQKAKQFYYQPQPQTDIGPRPSVSGNGRPVTGDGRQKTILVIGGSQGSQVLNLTAITLAASLCNLRFILLTGTRNYQTVKSLNPPANCETIQWTDHPQDLYIQATLAVTRGGGLVLSELLAFGIPSIIIPLPSATHNHQDANARYLQSTGAALCLEQTQLSALLPLIQTLTLDDTRLKKMSDSARQLAPLDAAQVISRAILNDIRQGKGIDK